MRILVVSDTHGNQLNLLKAHTAAGTVDAVIHLGDGEADAALLAELEAVPLYQVAGNCDCRSTAPKELICSWEGCRLLLCHGDRYGVKLGLSHLLDHARVSGVDAVLYGHTHHALHEQHDRLLVLNPGTLWGRAPFLSYAILEIENGTINATIQILPD